MSLKLRRRYALRQNNRAGVCQLFYDAYYLVGVAILVVVPHVQHQVLAGGDGSNAVDNAGVGIADEVRGNNLWGGNVGNLLAQVGVQGNVAEEVVDLIGPDHTIVMAVPYGDREWMAQSQSDVIDAAKKYDNVYLADWCTHAQNNPDLRYSDGIHPLAEGASEYALAFHYALLQYSNYDKNLDSKCQI